jgi:P-type conjugative transfer protein TrbL
MVEFLDTAKTNLINGINVLTPLIILYGLPLIGVIALLAFAANAVMSMVKRDLGAILDSLSYTLLVLGFVEFAFLHAVDWMTAVQDTFVQLGLKITGQSPQSMTPGGIMVQGLDIAAYLFAAGAKHGWVLMSAAEIEALLSGVTVCFAFLFIAIILLLCEVDLAGIIVIGSILLIFCALPWTLPTLHRYALTVLGLSMKLLALMAIIGVGLIEAARWQANLASTAATITQDIHNIILPAMEAILFVFLAYKVPNEVAGLVSGGNGPGMSIGEALMGAAVAEGAAGARAGAQKAALAGIGAAAGATGTAAGTLARQVRNLVLNSN